jgi:hypothetical protein
VNPRVWIAISLLAVAAPPAAAQERHPDFTGVWTLVDSAAVAPSIATRGDAAFRVGDMGSGWGSPITLAHEPDRLTVEYVYFSTYDLQPPLKYLYALDGSESINRIMIGHSASEQRSRAAWQGEALIITTRYAAPEMDGGGQTAEVRQSLRLAAPDRLEIETTRVGVNGATTTVTRTAYIRN